MIKKILICILFSIFTIIALPSYAVTNTVTGEIKLLKKDGSLEKYRSNVIVFLESTEKAQPLTVNKEIIISQRGRHFRPSVLPITKGTSVTFPNDDRVMHNVFSKSKIEPFDLGNYKKNESRSVNFDTPGHVKVYCNIHANMELDILVLNTPYFVKTKKDGLFLIQGIPDGSYILRVWHELSEGFSRPISLSGNEVQQHTFEIQKTNTRSKHKNKYGKPYRGKY